MVAALRLDRGPVLGGLAGGLVTAVCCGGLPLFAGIGLGALFAGLRIWRFLPPLVAAGMLVIVGINWWFYRRNAAAIPPGRARSAMLTSTGIGLVFMAAAIYGLDQLERSGVINVEQYMRPGISAQPHSTGEAEPATGEAATGEPARVGDEELARAGERGERRGALAQEKAAPGSLEEPEGTGTAAVVLALVAAAFGLGLASLLALGAATGAGESRRRHEGERAARDGALVGLGGLVLVHLIEAPGVFRAAPVQGWMFVGLIAASLGLMGMLLAGHDQDRVWRAIAGLAGLSGLLYVLSRIGGLPGIAAPGDAGDWSNPFGIAALILDAGVIAVSALVVSGRRRARTVGVAAPGGVG